MVTNTNSGGGSRKGVHHYHHQDQQQQQRDDHMMLAPPPQLLHLIMAEGGELKVSACEKYVPAHIRDWPPFLFRVHVVIIRAACRVCDACGINRLF